MHLSSFRVRAVLAVLAASAAIAFIAGPSTAAQKAWTTHRDPSGYIVDVPPNWAMQYDAQHHKVTLAGTQGERVVLRLVTAARALDPDQGADVGQALAKDAGPTVRWKEAELASNTIAVVPSQRSEVYGKAYFTWNSTPALSVGYLYVQIGAPAVIAADRSTIRRIFASYRIALPGQDGQTQPAAAAAPMQYARFTEPGEHMFSVDLPAAWARSGGIYRQSALDIRPAFRAEIKGSAAIQSGDPSIPFFSVPTAAGAVGGFYTEGKWMPYPGMQLMVRRYTEGTAFARQYALDHFGGVCSEMRADEVRPRPDASAQLNTVYAQLGLPAALSAGEVSFTCSMAGAPMRGYVFAATELVKQPTNAIWYVPILLSFIAHSESSGQAAAALQHAVGTYQIDPQWARTNAETAKNISDITTRTGDAMSKIISDTFRNRSESQSRISATRSNANRGLQNAIDPVTKTTLTIDNRYDNNWIDHSGNIVGSDVSAKPGPEFRRLITGR